MRYLEVMVDFLPQTVVSFPPNPVNTLRGALGYQLKRIVCFQRNRPHDSCRGCLAEQTCAYALTFETAAVPGLGNVIGGGGDAPHPMVMNVGFTGPRAFQAQQSFRFGLTLFSRAVETLPLVIHALREAGKHGLSRDRVVCDLTGITHAESGQRLYDPVTHSLAPFTASRLDLAEPSGFGAECMEMTLQFESPTAFKDKATGKVVNNLEFPRLVRSLLRRHSALGSESPADAPAWNYREIIRRAEEVAIVRQDTVPVFWERFSTRQAQRSTWGGTIGSVTYCGDLRPFLALLRAGELLRVGRGTIFGQGKYKIERIAMCEAQPAGRPDRREPRNPTADHPEGPKA